MADFARQGIVLVVSGPSGTGKSTVCNQVLDTDENLQFSVSCTTRKPRPGEVDGEDYHYLKAEDFLARVADGDFIEHAEVHGNHYGTLRSEITKRIDAGIDILLDIDVQGARLIRDTCSGEPWYDAVHFILIGPPSMAELERRLTSRGTEDQASLSRRLGAARSELDQWQHYDYLVINDDLDVAIAELRAILTANRLRTARLSSGDPWG